MWQSEWMKTQMDEWHGWRINTLKAARARDDNGWWWEVGEGMPKSPLSTGMIRPSHLKDSGLSQRHPPPFDTVLLILFWYCLRFVSFWLLFHCIVIFIYSVLFRFYFVSWVAGLLRAVIGLFNPAPAKGLIKSFLSVLYWLLSLFLCCRCVTLLFHLLMIPMLVMVFLTLFPMFNLTIDLHVL